ncbi:hypothetical protein AX16_008507 [Volvariella volvacea WC 439]|nr:hypothetical protein AX16_008507 [Volvariella volvacea WC 439]
MPHKSKPPSRYNIPTLLLIGLVFHVVFIGSVFDCYFTSPVVTGMQTHNVGQSLAKRLVLIVGDGLRADLLFNTNPFPNVPDSPQTSAPYLREIAERRGAFGISHTRVPTESRPGHVAIIGGMYEDVSAVTKGWKTNPVDFDSVFNQSSTTFSFGSPDILPMFARGATPGKVKTWSYDEDDEDFTKDATELDIWVLDKLMELFSNATTDSLLNAQLRSDKVVIFLHLLGLDTTGHSYRPHSPEYMRNIEVVDSIVQKLEGLVKEFYHDEETSFIFTADHGMSTIGNHGDGHPDNTRTPLIAWGCGIRGPLLDTTPSSHDSYSQPWGPGLTNLYRRDVEQADIASLMAALLGIDWPANSVGVLPDADPTRPGFLEEEGKRGGEEFQARAAFVNAKVVLEQYKRKHELKQQHTLFYKPFKPLEYTTRLTQIQHALSQNDWYTARTQSSQLIQQALQGLHYLQTYDRTLIQGIVVLAYTGWAAFCALYIFKPLEFRLRSSSKTGIKHESSTMLTAFFAALLFTFWTAFAVQRSSWTFYVYVTFPCYFWWRVGCEVHQSGFLSSVGGMLSGASGSVGLMLVKAVGVWIVLQGMVVAYTHRSIWSIGFLVIGLAWPLNWSQSTRESVGSRTLSSWIAMSLVTGVFPLLSVDKKESLGTILFGGSCILAAATTFSKEVFRYMRERGVKSWSQEVLTNVFLGQGVLIVLTMLVTTGSVWSLQAKQGLPLVNQIAGWVLLVTSSVFPFISSHILQLLYSRSGNLNTQGQHSQDSLVQTVNSRLLTYFLGFGPCFVILSLSVEGLFYVAYSAILVVWIEVEAGIRRASLRRHQEDNVQNETASKSANASHEDGVGGTPSSLVEPSRSKDADKYKFRGDDLRIALFFLFFVQVGFFGTGNVASISSFYLEPVYRLIPIFSPFFMAALLIFKIVAPYIILSLTFATLNHRLNLPPFSLFLVAMTLTDGMTLTFFFNVTDTGSWLEIGQSISFFCITSLLLLWSAGIYAAGEYLMADVIRSSSVKDKDE